MDKPCTMTLIKNDPVKAEVEHVKSALDVLQRNTLNAECMPIIGEHIGLAYPSRVNLARPVCILWKQLPPVLCKKLEVPDTEVEGSMLQIESLNKERQA